MGMNADTYLANVATDADAMVDPLARARALNDEIAAVSDVLAELGLRRTAAVRQARATMSAVEVAAALGVTRARVYQITDD